MISTTDLVVVAATTKSPLLPGKVIDFGLLPLVLFFFIASTHMAFAEGIPELKPSNDNVRLIINRSSDAGGNRTNFAGWGNSDPFSRLYIHITDPSKECIYLGLGLSDFGGNDDLDPEFNGNAIRYRVLSPDGSTAVVDRTIPLANLNITGASDADMYNNAKNGPFEIEGAGYTAGSSFTISPAHFAAAGLSNVSGDYFIEFTEVDANGDPVNPEDDTQSGAWDGFELEFFDFTVADCANPSSPIEKIGRVWSWRWEMTTTSPNIPFMGAFYVCADDESTPAIPNDAFITKIDFENVGFTPYAFSVFFNSNGVMNTGNPVVDRRSVTGEDAMGTPEHRAFLNDPRDIAPTAQFGSPRVEVYFERCSASGPFTYCFQVNLDKVGSQIDILLDLNGSPGYQPGTADVVLSKKIEPGEQGFDICLPWDGKDGTGAPVDPDELNTNNVIPTYSEGIFHFPIFDAETNAMSFNVTYVRPIPTGASAIQLKWDDSLINDAPINDPHPGPCQKVNLEGCSVGLVSCTRCWTDFDYGDRATLNTFWTTLTKLLEFNIRSTGYYTCDITGDNELCQGDATTLSANLTLLSPGATAPSSLHYSWTGPNGPVGGNSASLNINDFDPADDAGTYTLNVFFGSECSSSCTFDLRASNNCQADLSLDKSVSDNTPDVGQTITFTLEVINNGPANATNVTIQDKIPNGYSNIMVTDGIGVYNGGTGFITWNIAEIPAPPDENVIELTYTAQVNAPTNGTSYYNVAQVTDSDQEDPDSDPGKDETEDDDGDGDPFDDDEDFEEVCPNPAISITPGPVVLCIGSGTTLSVVSKAGGTGNCTVSWFVSSNGINFSPTGTTGDTYDVPASLPEGARYYKARYECNGPYCEAAESNVTEVIVVPQSSATIENFILGYDYATSGVCGNFNVLMEVEICNEGETIIANLSANVNLAAQANGVFAGNAQILGFVEDGEATYSSVFNDDFDGENNLSLFDEAVSLGVSKCVRVRISFEVAPEEAASQEEAYSAIFASTVGALPGNLPGEETSCLVGIDEDEIELGDCWYKTRIAAANDNINVTVTAECTAIITPDMILENHLPGCDSWEDPLGGFYRLRVLYPGQTEPGEPLPWVELNANDFPNGMAIIYVENVGQECLPLWGKVTLEDKRAPYFECEPEEVYTIENTYKVQTADGVLKNNDPRLNFSHYSCFQDENGSPDNCEQPYDVLEFYVSEADVYTFEAWELLGNDEVENGDELLLALYQGEFDPDQPCSNIIGQSNSVSEYGVVDPGLNPDARIRMAFPLFPGKKYSLLVAQDDCPDNHDAYRIYAFSDQDGEILNENSETSGVVEELTDHFSDPRPLRVEKELFCSDVEYILNNSDYTPNPTPLDNCDEEPETWFIDELTETGDCGDIYITRTWYIRDAAGNQGQNCVQTIYFKRPELEDVQKPATTVPIECDELSSEWLDENGRPNPAVAGYPFVITAFGVADLKESLCNIGADYRDISVIDVCDNTQKIVRQWIILDWCDIGGQWELNNGTLNNWRQIIKVGDFSAPVLSVDGVDSVIPTNAQSCAGSLLLPDVEVSDNCSADYTIVATVYLLEDAPILDPYGEPTGETQVVTTKIFEGTAGDVVYELPLGNTYKVHYQVEDNCGNEAETEYTVTIEDKVAPIAVCDDDFNISIGGNGIGRITAQDVDEGSWDNCQLKDIYVSRKLPGDDFRDAYLAEIYGITFAALELDEDVEDKDQNVDSEVWVMKSNGVEVLRKKNNMWYTWWKYDVWFLCEDGGTEVLIELLAEDIYGNTNVCWQEAALEDKVAPYCEAPEDVVIDCSELPYGFDPEDNSQLAALFGEATGIDNCGSANARQISKSINWNCNSGTIVRAFVAEDLNETVSLNTCQQTIIVNPEHSYEIRFPKDVTADCESPNPDTATWNEIGCDLLIVNVVDDPFQAVVDACYKIRRTYSIINWCEYDGESDPVIVSRDHDCDGIGGNEDVYVLRRLDGDVFFDADDDETNSAPAKNERGCNPKNPKGYWEKNAQFGEAVVSSGYWQYTQFIKITDNTPPEIEIEGAGLFCSENNQSCDALVQIPFTIADVCSGPSDITVKAFVNDQLTVVGGVYPDYSISGRFEIGVYELVIQAEDGCGQTQEVEMEFEVIDCLAPAPICINGLILELTPVEPGVDADGDGDEDKGAADVWVSDFKVSGLEDCTELVKLSINLVGETPDPNQTSLILTCDDPDTLAVEIYAWDSADNPTAIQPDGTVGGPNYDHCVTYILLQDNMFNLCNSGPQPASISGLLTNRDDEPVEFADVNMTGGMIKSMNTNASGVYGFTELTSGVDYTITPVRNDDHRNGVNTLDLVKINKHLLGTARLQDPYQMIAADVNQSGTITAFDLIHMRKLLLGIYTEFPATRSWRFIPADYAFPDDNNPWAEDIPEVLNYNNVATLIASGDFIALKMGDINNSAKPNSQAASPRNLAGVFKLNAADQTLRPSSEYRVSFTTEELARIQGYQFTLNFDVNALELVDMEYGLAKAEHFGLVYVDEGAITTSWNHKEGREEPGDAELFTLIFRAKQSGRLSELLSLGSRYTQAEAYNPSDELLDVVLDFGAAAESDRADSFWLEQNAPNPWTDHTQIGFYLPEAAAVKLTIRDARGRVLKTIRSDFEAGFQQFELNKESTKLASGVLYYTLETSKFSATKKMVWLGKK